MPLTRKPTDFGDGPVADDWAIYDGGRAIGRVLKVPNVLADPWIWSITVRVPQLANDRGHAPDLDGALAAFKAAWLRK